jgi:hypothetical protein
MSWQVHAKAAIKTQWNKRALLSVGLFCAAEQLIARAVVGYIKLEVRCFLRFMGKLCCCAQ